MPRELELVLTIAVGVGLLLLIWLRFKTGSKINPNKSSSHKNNFRHMGSNTNRHDLDSGSNGSD